MGSGKRWDSTENLSACQSFCRASTKSTNGTGQKKEKFQADIEEEYDNLVQNHMARSNWTPSAKRTGNAIFLQFKRIRKDCLRFEECMEKVRQLNMTGSPTDSDYIRVANAVYNDPANIRTPYKFVGTDAVESAPNFKYINCYLWLRTQHLWRMIAQARANVNQYRSTQSALLPSTEPIDIAIESTTPAPSVVPALSPPDSDSDTSMPPVAVDDIQNVETKAASSSISEGAAEGAPVSTPTRPLGAKKQIAKATITTAIQKSSKVIERLVSQNDSKMDLMKSLIGTLKERNDVERRREEFDLFNASLVPEEQRREYLTMRTAAILCNMRTPARDGPSPTSQTTPPANANEHDDDEDEPNPTSTLAAR